MLRLFRRPGGSRTPAIAVLPTIYNPKRMGKLVGLIERGDVFTDRQIDPLSHFVLPIEIFPIRDGFKQDRGVVLGRNPHGVNHVFPLAGAVV